jgi:hypothetical protein
MTDIYDYDDNDDDYYYDDEKDVGVYSITILGFSLSFI